MENLHTITYGIEDRGIAHSKNNYNTCVRSSGFPMKYTHTKLLSTGYNEFPIRRDGITRAGVSDIWIKLNDPQVIEGGVNLLIGGQVIETMHTICFNNSDKFKLTTDHILPMTGVHVITIGVTCKRASELVYTYSTVALESYTYDDCMDILFTSEQMTRGCSMIPLYFNHPVTRLDVYTTEPMSSLQFTTEYTDIFTLRLHDTGPTHYHYVLDFKQYTVNFTKLEKAHLISSSKSTPVHIIGTYRNILRYMDGMYGLVYL
jgi:hypothetical protein